MGLEGIWKDEDAGVLVRLVEIKMDSAQNTIYGPFRGRVETIKGDWLGNKLFWDKQDVVLLIPVLPKRDLWIMLNRSNRRCSKGWEIQGVVYPSEVGKLQRALGVIPTYEILEAINDVGRGMEK